MKTKGLGQCQSILYYYKQKLTELSKKFHLKLLRKVLQIQVDFRTFELWKEFKNARISKVFFIVPTWDISSSKHYWKSTFIVSIFMFIFKWNTVLKDSFIQAAFKLSSLKIKKNIYFGSSQGTFFTATKTILFLQHNSEPLWKKNLISHRPKGLCHMQ